MKELAAHGWWWIWPLISGFGMLAYALHRRGGEESLPSRVLYVICPILDPRNEEERRRVVAVQLPIVVVGFVLILIALGIVQLLTP
jgi:hypothetical protein